MDKMDKMDKTLLRRLVDALEREHEALMDCDEDHVCGPYCETRNVLIEAIAVLAAEVEEN